MTIIYDDGRSFFGSGSSYVPKSKTRKRNKKNRSKKRTIKTGTTKFFWCVYCDCKTRFVWRKIEGETGFFFDKMIDFNDGTRKEIGRGRYFYGDQCVECKYFIAR